MSDLIEITTKSGNTIQFNKKIKNSATLLFMLRDFDRKKDYLTACDLLEFIVGGEEQRKKVTSWLDEHSEGGVATVQDLMEEIQSIIAQLGEDSDTKKS